MKHSRIWDTLPTSKMELFVTIGIYKVIFFRLMILYTQCSSMSVFICDCNWTRTQNHLIRKRTLNHLAKFVFICVSSLQSLFCSRWFHIQAFEMVFFVTITIANVVFYWAMVLHVQFFPMNFFFLCQFVAESISLQVVPGSSSLF